MAVIFFLSFRRCFHVLSIIDQTNCGLVIVSTWLSEIKSFWYYKLPRNVNNLSVDKNRTKEGTLHMNTSLITLDIRIEFQITSGFAEYVCVSFFSILHSAADFLSPSNSVFRNVTARWEIVRSDRPTFCTTKQRKLPVERIRSGLKVFVLAIKRINSAWKTPEIP